MEIDNQKPNKRRRGNPNWTKGTSGNPKGRPPDPECVAPLIRQKLSEAVDEGSSCAERIAQVLIDLALAGNLAAIREILDRVDGKPTPCPTAMDEVVTIRRIIISDGEMCSDE